MKSNWFKSTGILRYGTKDMPHSQRLPVKNKWWLVLDCCDDIVKYYKQFAEKNYGIKLLPVTWGAHVSVITGEKPFNEDRWEWMNNQPVEFCYSNQIDTNEEYYWLPVQCSQLVEIRKELGLSEKPQWNFHLTIGKKHQDIYYPDKYMIEIKNSQ